MVVHLGVHPGVHPVFVARCFLINALAPRPRTRRAWRRVPQTHGSDPAAGRCRVPPLPAGAFTWLTGRSHAFVVPAITSLLLQIATLTGSAWSRILDLE